MKIHELLKQLFEREDFVYASNGKVTGKDFLFLNCLLNGEYEGDYLVFDNRGGRKFDISVNQLPDCPNLVRDFTQSLLKQHPNWVYAYRIDGVETICDRFYRAFQIEKEILNNK